MAVRLLSKIIGVGDGVTDEGSGDEGSARIEVLEDMGTLYVAFPQLILIVHLNYI